MKCSKINREGLLKGRYTELGAVENWLEFLPIIKTSCKSQASYFHFLYQCHYSHSIAFTVLILSLCPSWWCCKVLQALIWSLKNIVVIRQFHPSPQRPRDASVGVLMNINHPHLFFMIMYTIHIPYSWHYISPSKVFIDALKAKIQVVWFYIWAVSPRINI